MDISILADYIGKHESRNDYSAYNRTYGGLRSFFGTDLESMTLKQVMLAQDRREMFAVGKFQVIPSTLKAASIYLNLDIDDKFDNKMQDMIFEDYLLRVKRPQIIKYIEGVGDLESAMLAVAKEWAFAPVRAGVKIHSGRVSKGGESYYSGDGYNRAGDTVDNLIKTLRLAASS